MNGTEGGWGVGVRRKLVKNFGRLLDFWSKEGPAGDRGGGVGGGQGGGR